MSTPQPARPSSETPRLLRNAVTRTTTQLVGTVIGSMVFIALGLTMLLAPGRFVGGTFRFLFIRFTADYPIIMAVGAASVLFFGFTAFIAGWEFARRMTERRVS